VNLGIVYTKCVGRLTAEDLIAHYSLPFFQDYAGPWRELVDGREITDMAVTPQEQERFASFATRFMPRLRGGRVAMVASRDVVYGMFRMWELRREDLEYEVRVFREIEPARSWLNAAL
jgi:hypothetical protein